MRSDDKAAVEARRRLDRARKALGDAIECLSKPECDVDGCIESVARSIIRVYVAVDVLEESLK